jgi:hypothetical protein
MAYLEAFLLYLVLVIVGGLILLFLLFAIYGIVNLAVKRKKGKYLQTSILKKVVKTFAVIYLIAMSVFYVQRVNTLLLGERAYKEAKAYAIAGEYVFLWKVALLKMVYPNNAFLKPFDTIESYILQKIYSYIPEDDAEREIWNYKFHLLDYARTMYAPRVEADIEKGLSFTNPAASMRLELLDILNNIYTAMDRLNTQQIKDKEFSEVDRNLVIAALAPYFIEYIPYMADLHSNWKNSEYYGNKLKKIYKTPEFRSKLISYLKILDQVHKNMQSSEKCHQAFESYPRLKVAYYWGATLGYSLLDSMQTELSDIYPCTNPTFLKWVENYKEFVKWAYMTSNSSYHSLSRREKKNYAFKIENQNNAYYIAKYICKIPFDYMVQGEANIDEKYRVKNFSFSMEMRSNIKHIRKLEKNLKQEKNL